MKSYLKSFRQIMGHVGAVFLIVWALFTSDTVAIYLCLLSAFVALGGPIADSLNKKKVT